MRPVVRLLCLFLCTLLSPLAFSYIQTYPAVESNATTSTVPLFVAFITSFGGAFNSSHSIPGVQLALDHINQDPTMLPGYTLHYTLTDSQCNHSVALKGFFQQILQGPPKVAVLGAGCSVATESVADISHFYNLTHISCASSSASLANRIRFKNYFQLLPAEDELSPVFVALSREYNWRRITIIKQNENMFSRLIDQMLHSFSQMNISWILHSLESSKDDVDVLSFTDVMFSSENRITFLAMHSVQAKQYICEAYRRGFRYPQYVYIMYGWYRNQWWYPVSGENITCNNSQMEQVLERSLTVTQYPQIMNLSEVTDTGEDYNTFRMGIEQKLESTRFEFSDSVGDCYDAMWALAQALNRTASDLNTNNTLSWLAALAEPINATDRGFNLGDFSYKNNIVQRIMFKHLEKTNFTGITGPVTFDRLGIRRVNRLRISQYRKNGNMKLNKFKIASVFPGTTGFQYSDGENCSSVWPEFIPYDGVANNVTVSVSVAVTVPYTLLTILGIVFAVVCLSFNIIFRNTKLVRLSSPSLNYVIIVGALIMYLTPIFFILPVTDQLAVTVLCNIRSRLLSIGYCLCLGTILAKMWRVYYIFNNPSPKRTAIMDWHLGLLVAVLVFINLVIIIVTAALPLSSTLAMLVPSAENPYEEIGELRNRTDFFIYTCDHQSTQIWAGAIFGYLALLQIAALFLAFGTRKVKVKGLNDSLYITATVYSTSVLLVFIITVSIILSDRVNLYAVLLSTSIIMAATVILGLVFIPKMVWLYKDPKGVEIFSTYQTGQQQQQQPVKMAQLGSSSTVDGILSDQHTSDKEKINILVARVKELESMTNDNGQQVKSYKLGMQPS